MIIVEPQHLSDAWPKVERWIDEAVKANQGDENTLDVLIAVARGHYVLWVEPNLFAAVVQVQQYPRHRVGQILYLGGRDLGAIEVAFEEAKRYAKKNQIDVIRCFGRPGWERLLGLKRKGYIMQVQVT